MMNTFNEKDYEVEIKQGGKSVKIDLTHNIALKDDLYGGPIHPEGKIELPEIYYLDPVTRSLGALNQIAYYFSEGADKALKILYFIVEIESS